MPESGVEEPFQNLPEDLVEDMLEESQPLSSGLADYFTELESLTEKVRKELREQGLLRHENEIQTTISHPTACGVDGAYAIDRLLATDILAIASLAIEGLTPPSEESFWPRPRHYSVVTTADHSEATGTITRAIMTEMEIILAAKAPHNVVFLDGSLLSPAITFNQGIKAREQVDDSLAEEFNSRLDDALEAYATVLETKRTDRAYVSVPKYTTQHELLDKLEYPQSYEDRALLSFLLKPGEIVGPLTLKSSHVPRQLDQPPLSDRQAAKKIDTQLHEQDVLYYRPYKHSPALRLEMSRSVTRNNQRLASVLEAVQVQMGVSNVLEPYPLYITDRMVKHIGTALPAIRQAVTQQLAMDWNQELEDMYLALHGYRTETGFGG